MSRNQQIEKQVDAAMASIDQIARVSPAPFFYTRLHARLMREESNWWGRLGSMLSRPAIAAGSIGVVLMINLVVVFHHTSQQVVGAPDHAEIAVADEYNSANALYRFDNAQP